MLRKESKISLWVEQVVFPPNLFVLQYKAALSEKIQCIEKYITLLTWIHI